MKCEEVKNKLAVLEDEDSRAGRPLVEHAERCDHCRRALLEYRELRAMLGEMRGPVYSGAEDRVKRAVRGRIATATAPSTDWHRAALAPFAAGLSAALLLFVLGISIITAVDERVAQDGTFSESDVVVNQPATINPQGALINLPDAYAATERNDLEVVVVADVFGDGLAQIAEVVEPSPRPDAIRELERALKVNPDYAPPFLPAEIDHRSDSVRVVLKIQTVHISPSDP